MPRGLWLGSRELTLGGNAKALNRGSWKRSTTIDSGGADRVRHPTTALVDKRRGSARQPDSTLGRMCHEFYVTLSHAVSRHTTLRPVPQQPHNLFLPVPGVVCELCYLRKYDVLYTQQHGLHFSAAPTLRCRLRVDNHSVFPAYRDHDRGSRSAAASLRTSPSIV